MWKRKSSHCFCTKSARSLPEITNLYRNDEFNSSDSSGSGCVKCVQITVDRKIKTKTVGNVNDRHLLANLELPQLKERCAASTNKDLYKLSNLLEDNESEVTNQKHWDNKVHVKARHVKRGKINNLNEQTQKQQISNSMKNPMVSSEPETPNINNLSMLSETSSAESKYQTAESGSQTINEEIAEIFSETYVEQAAEPQLDPSTFQEVRCQNCTKIHRMAQQLKRFGHSRVTYLNLAFILFYYLIFFVCACAFLAYMLCYDAIEYVNEESRYLAKMKASCFELKCFYYIMRLLKVPIF